MNVRQSGSITEIKNNCAGIRELKSKLGLAQNLQEGWFFGSSRDTMFKIHGINIVLILLIFFLYT